MATVLGVAGILLAAAWQATMPTLGWLGGVRLEILPAVVAYAALTVRRPALVALWATWAGLAHDSVSAAPFGMTMGTFGVAALGLWSLRGWLDRDLPTVQMLAGAVVSLLAGGVAMLAVGVTPVALLKLGWITGLNAVVTGMVFWIVDMARRWLGVAAK
jgi:hypothetical protein